MPSTAATAIVSPSSSMVPMQHVLETSHRLRDSWACQEARWMLDEKVTKDVFAEEVSSILASHDCRKQWDNRFRSALVLESFASSDELQCYTRRDWIIVGSWEYYLLCVDVLSSGAPPVLVAQEIQLLWKWPLRVLSLSQSSLLDDVEPARLQEVTPRVSRVLTGAIGLAPDTPHGGEPFSLPVRSQSTKRARSSAFTLQGELKQSTDLAVGEVLVDSKPYPERCSVQITSSLREVHIPSSTFRDVDGRNIEQQQHTPYSANTVVHLVEPECGVRRKCVLSILTFPTVRQWRFICSEIVRENVWDTNTTPGSCVWHFSYIVLHMVYILHNRLY
ncbi:hypothetical protein BKA82DRAFT_30917 [Pisolithus tinctorius]|uniref:START domain-containing protein n=1 Tax=Pisolithus tinctorius Marx 270 TaxID=870435 RepID=A0A0C3NCW7_PISTI|nr:hypothetical protein BKA82DRAFT_30917 [Pisolithus tinctorius]KIN98954.1 hypothetical protein M404DRAFT_30917 [Pisolithus tinctorius Marx 270]